MEQTDADIVRKVLAGDRDAYAELVRRHRDAVFGLAVSMTRNREDAEDMTQEAFIRAYQKLDRFDPERSFRSWILRICANQAKNLFRKRVRRRATEERHLTREMIAHDGADPDYEALEEALARLPRKLEAPIRLKFIEQLPYEEVASILGIGVSAAKMRVLRAKKLLAEYLQ